MKMNTKQFNCLSEYMKNEYCQVYVLAFSKLWGVSWNSFDHIQAKFVIQFINEVM